MNIGSTGRDAVGKALKHAKEDAGFDEEYLSPPNP
jgi:hypothetical protein